MSLPRVFHKPFKLNEPIDWAHPKAQELADANDELCAHLNKAQARVSELESCLDIIINLRDSEESRIARTYRR